MAGNILSLEGMEKMAMHVKIWPYDMFQGTLYFLFHYDRPGPSYAGRCLGHGGRGGGNPECRSGR